MAQSSQLTALYAPINWVAEENIIFGPLATPFLDSWVQRVLDENYWDCSEAFTRLIARFRLLVRHREDFVKECQGIEYWCPNGNWLQPPSARPKVGEPELPTPQEYGHVQRPYGRIGIGIDSGKNSSSIALLVPPFRRHELPAMEPPAEARGPPSRFDTRLLPLGPNT
ncbi:hypothetical protein NCU03469 [Neurospora crassa OR74A]|uniref:Uncharacterized protein n=1 Tax=Neurospora crassa (strain ATCC 24698 / 74-OR23-1A / CBS 708.71 / DSM 1257 / FGSC 987) TaxID=367110 RepID=Q7RX65_NEUCR|nr:hypothetical protein NCU03469 [Neurospora crassa OR74A]EAA27122.1 hypothetical protein NCU03469 [Neurospora crassa OR74A]|eukprot:XP_956358.1 hypothetical protein NCU03469 [Neurospora crassa OR74A]